MCVYKQVTAEISAIKQRLKLYFDTRAQYHLPSRAQVSFG